jgi:P27 family predicted phage terminase small subunit
MGRRGPARKPTKIREITNPAKAKQRQDEPQPAAGVPECPDWLTEDARPLWFRVCAHLQGMGLLHRCDENAIARYAQLMARYIATEHRIAENPDHEKVEGWHMRAGALNDKIRMLEQQFGLTPAARANLAVEKKDPDENRGKRHFTIAG